MTQTFPAILAATYLRMGSNSCGTVPGNTGHGHLKRGNRRNFPAILYKPQIWWVLFGKHIVAEAYANLNGSF